MRIDPTGSSFRSWRKSSVTELTMAKRRDQWFGEEGRTRKEGHDFRARAAESAVTRYIGGERRRNKGTLLAGQPVRGNDPGDPTHVVVNITGFSGDFADMIAEVGMTLSLGYRGVDQIGDEGNAFR